MQKRIAVIYGDGIGKEVITQALKILKVVAKKYEHTFIFEEVLAGGAGGLWGPSKGLSLMISPVASGPCPVNELRVWKSQRLFQPFCQMGCQHRGGAGQEREGGCLGQTRLKVAMTS